MWFYLVLSLFISSCTTVQYGNLTQTFSVSKELIWKGMVKASFKFFGGVSAVYPEPPTIVTKPFIEDKEFGDSSIVYISTMKLTGFRRPYAVSVVVKKYPDTKKDPNHYEYDYDFAAKILSYIDKFIKKERFNYSIKEIYTPF